MPNSQRWTVALLAAGFLLTTLAPLAAAQVGTFGSQVKVGDLDFVPVAKKNSFMPAVYWLDGGGAGNLADLCVIASQNIYKNIESAPYGAAAGTANPGSSTPVDTPPATYKPSAKDVRLTGCGPDAAGSLVALNEVYTLTYAQATASLLATHSAQLTFQYFDANGNNKYDSGDTAYLVNNPANAGLNGGVAPKPAAGLVANMAIGAWSVRLTPFGTLPAGAPVLPTDADFSIVGKTKFTDLSMVAREDKSWYLVPGKPNAVQAAEPIPAFSIRIATAGVTSLQPTITATKVVPANPEDMVVGKPFPVLVTVTNTGGMGGLGLVLTKLDHQIVDARLSPVLSPGESAALLVNVPAPTRGGILELEVNDNFQPVSIAGNATAATGSGADLATLQAEIAQLQQQVSGLNPQAAGIKQQGAPGLAPLALMGCLVVAAMVLRTRRLDE